MSYALTIAGKIEVKSPPAVSIPSGDFDFRAKLEDGYVLSNKYATVVNLDADSAEPVSLADIAGANVVFLRVLGSGSGKVLATLTHADGASQAVPVDPMFLLVTAASAITALSLMRTPTIAAAVEVFLGVMAT